MGGRHAQTGLMNGMKPLDGFRLFMFHTAYNKMFATVQSPTLRFARALVYSSREMTPEQERHALTYREEVAKLTIEMEREKEARLKAAREEEYLSSVEEEETCAMMEEEL